MENYKIWLAELEKHGRDWLRRRLPEENPTQKVLLEFYFGKDQWGKTLREEWENTQRGGGRGILMKDS